jgi:hypothetical protein
MTLLEEEYGTPFPRPLTVRASTPGPLIVRPSVMSNAPLVRVMVPVVAKSIASGPGLALAAATAVRSEAGPLSRRLVTVKVLSSERTSRASRFGRCDAFRSETRRRCRRWLRLGEGADRRLCIQL